MDFEHFFLDQNTFGWGTNSFVYPGRNRQRYGGNTRHTTENMSYKLEGMCIETSMCSFYERRILA
jgi:hypothetical protein